MTKKIGVLTSGGDSPGMNAVIRSIVLSGITYGLKIYGIYNGYLGMFQNEIKQLDKYIVSDIINNGGTFLGSTRFNKFKEKNIRSIAIKNMINLGLDAVIIIGGVGSYMGAKSLIKMGFPCIALPGTIDNDVIGTDYTIGYYTALETIVEAIDKLKDTSMSHKRISILEVMGRNCGDLAIFSAIASGSKFIAPSKLKFNPKDLLYKIKENISVGKKYDIVVITENICNIFSLAKYIENNTGKETRATVLGHIQRGGRPVAYDRILASRMGNYAIKLILNECYGYCIGIRNEKLIHYNIMNIIKNEKKLFKKNILEETKNFF